MEDRPGVGQLHDQAIRHHQAGKLREADALYRQILRDDPNHVPTLAMLAVLAHQVNQDEAAVKILRRAIELEPSNPDLHNNLGVALAALSQAAQAIAAYERAIALRPDYAEAHNNLGTALRDAGHLSEAIAAYRQALALRADYVMARNNLGLVLQEKGELREAIECFNLVLELEPETAYTRQHLARAWRDLGDLDQSIASARLALEEHPDSPEALCTLGISLKEAAELDEALPLLRRAMVIPGDLTMGSHYLYCIHLHPDYDARRIHDEHMQWHEKVVKPLGLAIAPHTTADRSPDRRLRIGYLSADFREHSVGRFILPLLANHRHDDFEITCYSGAGKTDSLTQAIESYSDRWREVASVDDSQLYEKIRDDQIDILVDLAMHTHGARIMTLARKPAPIQVAYLAYCSTTGLQTMDYRLTDPHLDPPGHFDRFYSERSLRLPETWWCFSPHPSAPAVSPLPMLSTGHVTFGCLNGFCKVNDKVLGTWGNLLARVPNSRLILCARDGSHRTRTIERLTEQGIDSSRIDFVPIQSPAEHFRQYHQIDIALDPFPYPGGTTTCDALWMGVPVVTLPGDTAVSRAGVSILTNIGLTELIASAPDDYVRIAMELAENPRRLQQLRSELRDRVQNSPLMNGPRFARNVEAAYRQMWYEWLDSPTGGQRSG